MAARADLPDLAAGFIRVQIIRSRTICYGRIHGSNLAALVAVSTDHADHSTTLGCPAGAVRWLADDHPRRHGGDRCAAVDPAGSRVLGDRTERRGECLSRAVRWCAAVGRPDRRPHRTAPGLPARRCRLHDRVRPVRARDHAGNAHRRSVPAGCSRCGRLCSHPRHGDRAVSGRLRPGPGDRDLQLRRRSRCRDRSARWRGADRDSQLALGFPGQCADRADHRRACAACPAGGRGRADRSRTGRLGSRPGDDRIDADGVHSDGIAGAGLEFDDDDRLRRREHPAAGRLPRSGSGSRDIRCCR